MIASGGIEVERNPICIESKQSYTLCLWPGFLCGSCFELSNWGYPTLRHNELRDFTAEILSEVCADVCTEPPLGLQPLSGETLHDLRYCKLDGARLDISAAGFGGSAPKGLF